MLADSGFNSAVDAQAAPVVSIIIPCFNGERTVASAIESCLAQTYPGVEIVVVDDGSTDRSAEIVRSYREQVILVQQSNHGLSASRNAAVAASSGKYVVLLDADDALLPDCVARRVAILQADPNVGLVAGYYKEIDAQGNPTGRAPEVRTVWKGHAFRQATRRNWGPPVGWTFPVDVFRRVGGFDPLLQSAEDWDFVIRVSRRYSVGYDPTPQTLYRKSAGQMSSNSMVMMDMARSVLRKNRCYADNLWIYRFDSLFGIFEAGRRVLYECMFESRRARLATLFRLCLSHPALLWIGPVSVLTYVFGKRPSSRPNADAPAELEVTATA